MPYFIVMLTKYLNSDLVIKVDSEDEAERIVLEKSDDQFDWYDETNTEMTVSQIDDVRGAAIIEKSGGRGELLPRGIIQIDRKRVHRLVDNN